jgi:hypothetical protein
MNISKSKKESIFEYRKIAGQLIIQSKTLSFINYNMDISKESL